MKIKSKLIFLFLKQNDDNDRKHKFTKKHR